MKRTLLFWLSLTLTLICLGANVEKQYKKLIAKYDVADEAKTVAEDSCAAFWAAALENNELFRKFTTDMQKNGGAEKEAMRKTSQVPRFYPQFDESIIEEMQGQCDTILIDMGIANLGLNCSLHIIYSDDVNAYTVLTEDGFAMCVSTALINKKGMNYNILKGYVAHEFVHGALLHHMRSYYAEAKERRKNEIIGGIALGLNAVAEAVETYNATVYGIPTSGVNHEAEIVKINNKIKISTLKYTFKYCREQEIEADLLAYRFLENQGCAEEFINGLRILGTQYDDYFSEYSDHPTTTTRINFLKYVQEHPELGNTENKKLKKRLDPDYELY